MKKIFLFLFILQLFACKNDTSQQAFQYIKFEGKTMGTTYHITCNDLKNSDLKIRVDSLLEVLNLEVSTYIDSSVISKFNQAESTFTIDVLKQGHFFANFTRSKLVYEYSEGYFDPTVMPVVNYWGFGYTPKKKVDRVDSLKIDSLLQLVGFKKLIWHLNKGSFTIKKPSKNCQLDFSALAKGYGVDVVGKLLEKEGATDFLVEIGGEVLAKGVNKNGDAWKVGVNTPKEEALVTDFIATAELQNRAIASSGNYRNFYEVNGQKYSHTIDPKTGYPKRSNLLGVTVFAANCMGADAFATAFMVMGLEKAKQSVEKLPDIEAYFIHSNESGQLEGSLSSGLEQIEGILRLSNK